MKISFGKLAFPKKGAVVTGVLEGGKLLEMTAEIDASLDGLLTRAIESSSFSGKAHQTLSVFGPNGRVVLYGLGKGDDIDVLWSEAAGGTIQAHLAGSGETAATVLFERHGDEDAAGTASRAAHLGYGALLRSYRFDKYKSKQTSEDKPTLAKLDILLDDHRQAKKLFADLEQVAAGVFLARDLVSEPPNVLYPESYAERCRALTDIGLEVQVLDEKAMRKLGMGALLGVGQGSARQSQMVVMRWNGGKKGEAPLGFIGKGVTFDTGGISLKPAGGMEDMKWDMGGSAAVVGLMRALAGRKAKVNAVGLVGLVENMPDGNAQRPGDVVTSMSGQTIEIINTDAEGRLVLADVLWYAKEKLKPAFMIDLATLTGAMMVSLGRVHTGYFSNDDALAQKIDAAGAASGETVWRMPLGDEYNKEMDSDIADMKNAGPRFGGAITAACFLERFVDKTPWAHMDIAGVAWSAKDRPTVPKGGVGWGVRILDRLVRDAYEG